MQSLEEHIVVKWLLTISCQDLRARFHLPGQHSAKVRKQLLLQGGVNQIWKRFFQSIDFQFKKDQE